MTGETVLISGAGIAGPTLAYWLSVAGFRPTVLESAPALRSGGYVVDFWGLGYDIAEKMGLIGAIGRAGYHARELRLIDDDGRRLAGFGTRVFDELTQGRYVTVGRSDLSRLLFGTLNDKVETIFGDEIEALEERADHVAVRLGRGGERRFDLVVGADGLHSRVRSLAFGPQERFEKDLGYAVAAFEAEGYRPRDEGIYLMYGRPGHMAGRFTLRDDRALVLFVFVTDGRPLPTTVEGQKAMLEQAYTGAGWECPRMLKALDRTDALYFDRVSQIRMDRWSKGRIALVGDAAFCVSLTAGQGSALAMTAAYVLAGELANAKGRHEEAFARYEAVLRRYIETKQRGGERFAAAFAPRTRFGLWFRNQIVRAFAIPGLARLAVGREIVDALSLPDYRWRMPYGAGHVT